ncbi:hypothetical protein EDD22DRAFT_845191 [Suillus occidentalis]|nr:hypothetical protein EDD22DRAFT_845191 [Suillus occidentalis]
MSPADSDNTGTLSTPLRVDTPTQDASTIKSTLNSRGAAVISENISVLGVQLSSAKQTQCCKPSSSAVLAFRRPNSPSSCKSASSIRPGIENDFYSPCIEATNIALACLEDVKVDGMGDPVPAVNMTSTRRTENDTAVDDEENDERCKNKRKARLDTNAAGKPKKILWKDVLACPEFKRKTLGRTKGITSPPSSYTATDHVPTQPEYLLVDHLEAEAATPDPLQTPAPQPSSDTAFQSSGLTAVKASLGGSSPKRKAAETLEPTAKRFKMDSSNTDADLDVTDQIGLYAAEMFASNVGVNYHLNIIVVGRATNVVPVTSEALTKKYGNFQGGMVAKIFWGEASRTSEPDVLYKVKEIAKVHIAVRDHIPQLLWHHRFTHPTSAIREALGVPDPTTGSRVLYIPIFPKLRRSRSFTKKSFSMCGINVSCEGVYHRGVSPPNLMWYWKDGRRMGVLNDDDLSSLADDPCPRGNELTGTIPFMALDLLSTEAQRGEVKHLYRHDLESFMGESFYQQNYAPWIDGRHLTL